MFMCMCVHCTVYVCVHVLVRGLTTHTVTFMLYTDLLRRTQFLMNWVWTDLSECVHCTLLCMWGWPSPKSVLGQWHVLARHVIIKFCKHALITK